MLKRLLAPALVLALGCRPSAQQQAAACVTVRESLEMVRANIGGWCGTPNLTAHDQMVRLGYAAVPCLREALSDRDYEVALAAAEALRDLDRKVVLDDWCAMHRGHANAGICTFAPPPERSAIPFAH